MVPPTVQLGPPFRPSTILPSESVAKIHSRRPGQARRCRSRRRVTVSMFEWTLLIGQVRRLSIGRSAWGRNGMIGRAARYAGLTAQSMKASCVRRLATPPEGEAGLDRKRGLVDTAAKLSRRRRRVIPGGFGLPGPWSNGCYRRVSSSCGGHVQPLTYGSQGCVHHVQP